MAKVTLFFLFMLFLFIFEGGTPSDDYSFLGSETDISYK